MDKSKEKLIPKLVDFEPSLLSKLKDEALTGHDKLKYRGAVNPLVNDIIRAHYKRKEKRSKK